MNILLVEDEPPILRDIKAIIESFKEDYQIVACMTNGKDALDYLNENNKNVDVIISDLHIPVIDGLELIEHITKHMSHILCIILTGYSKFEYAKKAIEYGVFDYLLKPVDEEELRKQLKRAYSKKCMDYIHDNTAENEYHLGTLNANANSRYYLANICIGPFPTHAITTNSLSLELWKQMSLDEFFSKYIDPHDDYWIMNGVSLSEKNVLFSLSSAQAKEKVEYLYQLLAPFLDYPFTVTIAIYPDLQSVHTIYKSSQRLRAYLSRQVRLEKSQILYFTDEHSVEEDMDLSLSQRYQTRLTKLYEERNIKLFQAELKNYLNEMKLNEVRQTTIYGLFYKLINACIGSEDTKSSTIKIDIHEAVTDVIMLSDTYQVLYENLYSIFLSFFEAMAAKITHPDNKTDMLLKIDAYIKENYTKPINTKEIARVFGFTPAYLGKIFRDYKQLTPSEYIVQLRIKKAEQIFCADADCKIKEVANFIGYEDSLYFSKVFKKTTGISPKQYMDSFHRVHSELESRDK